MIKKHQQVKPYQFVQACKRRPFARQKVISPFVKNSENMLFIIVHFCFN